MPAQAGREEPEADPPAGPRSRQGGIEELLSPSKALKSYDRLTEASPEPWARLQVFLPGQSCLQEPEAERRGGGAGVGYGWLS